MGFINKFEQSFPSTQKEMINPCKKDKILQQQQQNKVGMNEAGWSLIKKQLFIGRPDCYSAVRTLKILYIIFKTTKTGTTIDVVFYTAINEWYYVSVKDLHLKKNNNNNMHNCVGGSTWLYQTFKLRHPRFSTFLQYLFLVGRRYGKNLMFVLYLFVSCFFYLYQQKEEREVNFNVWSNENILQIFKRIIEQKLSFKNNLYQRL